MNDEAAAGVHMDVGSAGSGPFKGAYANVVLLLRDVSAIGVVSALVVCSCQRLPVHGCHAKV